MNSVGPILDRFFAKTPTPDRSDVNQVGYVTSFFTQVRNSFMFYVEHLRKFNLIVL